MANTDPKDIRREELHKTVVRPEGQTSVVTSVKLDEAVIDPDAPNAVQIPEGVNGPHDGLSVYEQPSPNDVAAGDAEPDVVVEHDDDPDADQAKVSHPREDADAERERNDSEPPQE